MFVLPFLIGLVWLAFPIAALVVALRARDEIRGIFERLDRAEAKLRAQSSILGEIEKTSVPSAAPSAAPPAVPIRTTTPVYTAAMAHDPPQVATGAAAAPTAAPTPAATPPPSPKPLDSDRLEQLIGGIWLQNVGSVLLLLGTFFLILWGYTQGKIGPEILVAAGVALGAVVAWRGDHIARTLRPLGHALLGVGLGVIYITLYLGHFRMGVLPEWATFMLLSLLSFLTVDIGLRRRQAVIASLGVAGAFVPLLMVSVPGSGFHLTPRDLIGYFALVNAVVFVLSASRGWSGLVIMALVLTTITWGVHTEGIAWGLPIQLAMCALYMGLQMAPVVRFVRSPNPVRGVDLAVVALAPMLLLIGTLPYLAATKGATTGGLLAALGLTNLVAALWVDSRRSERDLWRPLTAAATIFVAASLERLLAKEYLSLAWCVEGVVLVWLGIAPRGGWIRGMGYIVSSFAVLRLLVVPGSYDPAAGGGIGIFNGTALRDLLCVAALLSVSDRMGRRRESLSAGERHVPGLWVAAVNALIMIWFFREAAHLARWVAGPGTSASITTPAERPIASPALPVDSTLVLALVWTVHSAVLIFLAAIRRVGVMRHISYFVGGIALVPLVIAVSRGRYWKEGDLPIFYPAGLFTLFCVAGLLTMAAFLWSRRGTLAQGERRAPEVALVVAHVSMLLWTAREAGHVAFAIAPGAALAPQARESTAMLAAGLTSAAWIVQAGALLVLGWVRGSAFHRWMGLALVGLTLSKFVLFDLQRVDVFWRFVIALGVGAILLVFSFVYQRRNQSAERVG